MERKEGRKGLSKVTRNGQKARFVKKPKTMYFDLLSSSDRMRAILETRFHEENHHHQKEHGRKAQIPEHKWLEKEKMFANLKKKK